MVPSAVFIPNLESPVATINLVTLCNRTRVKAEEMAAQFGIDRPLAPGCYSTLWGSARAEAELD